ncbi:MAG TPA: LacI family transcriptional regulator, partial [Spirochaetota bacterium]|nr:LacI family transcriptional regulator [Spirochaetota bacterium]
IFYFCDNMAYGSIKAKNELNSDVVMVGYDDLLPSRYLGLTSVFQPAYQIGNDGADYILTLIKSEDSSTLQKCYNPYLIIRNT